MKRYAAMLGDKIVCESDTIDVPFAAVSNGLADRIVDRELKPVGYVQMVPAGKQTYRLTLDAEAAKRVVNLNLADFAWLDSDAGADEPTVVEEKS